MRTIESPLAGEEVDERFLRRYSCGTGCWLYLCNRVFWPIAVISFLLRGCVDSSDFEIEYALERGDHATANFYTAIGLIVPLVWLGFILWLGRVARRKRWERLKWKSFQQFAAEERVWNAIGAICWALLPVALVLLSLLESYSASP